VDALSNEKSNATADANANANANNNVMMELGAAKRIVERACRDAVVDSNSVHNHNHNHNSNPVETEFSEFVSSALARAFRNTKHHQQQQQQQQQYHQQQQQQPPRRPKSRVEGLEHAESSSLLHSMCSLFSSTIETETEPSTATPAELQLPELVCYTGSRCDVNVNSNSSNNNSNHGNSNHNNSTGIVSPPPLEEEEDDDGSSSTSSESNTNTTNNSNNNNNNNSNNIVADTEHYYLRLNGAWEDSNAFLFDELPFFRPDTQNDVFMVDPTDARGINCRLGSRGTIAETHYDMSRNFILILHGQKRYVLGHPDQCTNMELYPKGHPSARHSRINWSDPESWVNANDDGNGNFQHAFVNEVVLEAGDGLYLPTFWLHFIVSLSLNYQCNARSGITFGYQKHISACGF